jgi:lipopolysaccharide/colanic/teichoic acid biosynthesis glycosyltransferase
VHDYFSERYTVKPGLVSWSETCVYNESLTPEEMLYYDLFYVKNKSIDLDVRILKRFVHYFNGLHKGHNKLMWIFKRKPS